MLTFQLPDALIALFAEVCRFVAGRAVPVRDACFLQLSHGVSRANHHLDLDPLAFRFFVVVELYDQLVRNRWRAVVAPRGVDLSQFLANRILPALRKPVELSSRCRCVRDRERRRDWFASRT